MHRWHRWVWPYVGGIVALVLAYALAYTVGMATVENDPQSLLHSVKVVLIHFATVGYDTEFRSLAAMMALVGLGSFTGQTVVLVSCIAVIALLVYELSSSTARS